MKRDEDKKVIKIGFRISPIEKDEIQNYLDSNNLSLSEFLRKLVFSNIRKQKED